MFAVGQAMDSGYRHHAILSDQYSHSEKVSRLKMADLVQSQEVQVNFFAKRLYFCKDSSINDVYIFR